MGKPSRSCCVIGCTSTETRKPDLKFHYFPRSSVRCERWVRASCNNKLQALPLANLYRSGFRICSRHFSAAQYRHLGIKLSSEAIPDLCLPDSSATGSSEALLRLESKTALSDSIVVSKEVTTENLDGPKSDIIVKSNNEAVWLPKLDEVDDDSVEDFQDEIPLERYESLQDVPQSNTRFGRQNDPDPYHLIEELSEMYSLITLPYLEQTNLNLQWVYKILSGEEGCERIVYECPNKDDKDGFVLIRDSEWDGVSLNKLHLIAITYRPGIMSLRDLGKEHLNLLQNISNAGKVAILKKYGLVGTQLRIFLQYTPSFYHLHVHFTAMNDDICGPDFGTAHPLYSVIQIIQKLPTYYQDATLSICLRESDELFQEFETRGIVMRLPSS